jgi:predicted metal-dependent phosphoesterase TrpH
MNKPKPVFKENEMYEDLFGKLDNNPQNQLKNSLSGIEDVEEWDNKICSQDDASRLMGQGWRGADLHVHTWYSYDVLPLTTLDPLVIYKKAREKGLSFITFTDHDTMDAYDRVGWTREGIVPGVEIKILDSKRVGHTLHINVFELNKKQFIELEKIAEKDQNLETFITYLRENNLCYIYNHPFWFERNEKPNLKSVFEVAQLFPVIEYNMGRVAALNLQAMIMADKNSSGLVACTDTHSGNIGQALTLARGGTFMEYFNEIKAGRSYILPQNLTVKHMASEVNHRLQNLFNKENWHFEKPEYKVITGIKPFDNLIDMLVASKSNHYRILKGIICRIMKTINNSGIPTFLYIKAQQELVYRINQIVRQYTPVLDQTAESVLTV